VPPTPAFDRPIFVAGATGTVGRLLVPQLLRSGYVVRCLVRDPDHLGRPAPAAWSRHQNLQAQTGDLADRSGTFAALEDCQAAVYLAHPQGRRAPAERARDREHARNLAEGAAAQRLDRLVYLGALRETGETHAELAARREVERVLSHGGVPLTTLRAALIIGTGTTDYEVLSALVRGPRLPLAPRWLRTAVQPIALRDVVFYLQACLETPATAGRTLDIGGPEIVELKTLMDSIAEAEGCRPQRPMPWPAHAATLSLLWLRAANGTDRRTGAPFLQGLRQPLVCRDTEAARLMPGPLAGLEEAVALAGAACEPPGPS